MSPRVLPRRLRGAVLLAAPALALLAGPAVQGASATPATGKTTSGGGNKPVQCTGAVTGNPGDTYTSEAVQIYKGRAVFHITYTYKCSASGEWVRQ